MCLVVLLFFLKETFFGTRIIVHIDRLPHDRKLAAPQLTAICHEETSCYYPHFTEEETEA